ncbi:MAG: type III-B CRISPR module RAMP protein Cmr4 [Ktedonobacteraceae bacterium]|nr:type III-B CRISPR module RAMP protein Cmr4 [Ktedonobacteraceae bacterium]MBV9713472.1 type III-B CRISPR module RAMP protein Cmr4 [Ktedonobacteraceae bacterium]
MITATTMLYLYVETPLHAGMGSGLSSIDLPIQRERTTQYPMIQGSSIKGKLRALAEESSEDMILINAIFGPVLTAGETTDHAGALIAGDARILLFPVRSLSGVFAYTTSCDVLARFKRDIERIDTNQRTGAIDKPVSSSNRFVSLPWHLPDRPVPGNALVTTNSAVQFHNSLVLEEFSFTTQASVQVDAIATWLAEHALPERNADDYWTDKLKSSLVILPENDFRDFTLYATEIITRIRIDRNTKTVAKGALWTEEHLPTDTLLYVPIYATDARQSGKENPKLPGRQILEAVRAQDIERGSYLQLGGDETVGRGMVRVRWAS